MAALLTRAFNRLRGLRAETQAAAFLRQHGLRILEQNYHCRGGELDLIAKDGDTLVFVEVRLRNNHNFGGAAASISSRKQQRIIHSAQVYCLHAQIDINQQAIRFDVIAFEGEKPLQWIRDAFVAN